VCARGGGGGGHGAAPPSRTGEVRRPGSCGGGRGRRKGRSVGHAGGRTSATLLPLRRIESSRVILLPSAVISLRRRASERECVSGVCLGLSPVGRQGARGGSRAVGGSGVHALFRHVLEHHVDVVVEAWLGSGLGLGVSLAFVCSSKPCSCERRGADAAKGGYESRSEGDSRASWAVSDSK
jgi:hypothetical protein